MVQYCESMKCNSVLRFNFLSMLFTQSIDKKEKDSESLLVYSFIFSDLFIQVQVTVDMKPSGIQVTL